METYAKIHPVEFHRKFLTQGVRADGRTESMRRPVTVASGALSSAHGSAFVQVGRTKVVASVRGEIGLAPSASVVPQAVGLDEPRVVEDHSAESNHVAGDASAFANPQTSLSGGRPDAPHPTAVATVELLPLCSATRFPRGPPPELAQITAERINELLACRRAPEGTLFLDPMQLELFFDNEGTKAVGGSARPASAAATGDDRDAQFDEMTGLDETDAEQARRHRLSWYLAVDVYCLDYDGNLFDCALLATVAALQDTRLPAVKPVAWTEGDETGTSMSFPRPDALAPVAGGAETAPGAAPARSLRLGFVPVAVSFGLFDRWCLADPSGQEEDLDGCARLSVVLAPTPAADEQFCISQLYYAADGCNGSALGLKQLRHCLNAAKGTATHLTEILSTAVADKGAPRFVSSTQFKLYGLK